ncbi:MAG TPA: cytochrome P450 [Actinophytocola sp.]|uniref:cytochrome P450 n=1 Tax=Actinophytocola sp. TaxID=1872138 RepID=UPI002DB6A0BD|nr:cytochrome P450 [Actinophytocola sp.]HEU5472960.1 cytochrome P450 [Actinophytocola sp.]
MLTASPRTDIDLYTEAAIRSPYENYRLLRDLGPAVWLERNDVWAVARYRDVHAALQDPETFSSASGVALNDQTNERMRATTVSTDPPEHEQFRTLINRPLTPKALRAHQELFHRRADELVEKLLGAGTFDVVTDFAQVLPLSVVSDLLGWPVEGRSEFLSWSCAIFNLSGPMNERSIADLPALKAMQEYTREVIDSGRLRPGSCGADLLAAAEAERIDKNQIPSLIGAYLAPSIDTTVAMLSSALWLLGRDPSLWQAIRRDHSLIPNALNEVMRYESPVRGYTRLVTREYELDGTTLPAGSRVFLLLGAANRDERRWAEPDVFDIRRPDAKHHIAFGHGIHSCIGQGLVRLEGTALFTALAKRVRRIEVGEPTWGVNNVVRSLASLPVALHN